MHTPAPRRGQAPIPADLPLELDAVAIRLQADERLPDLVAVRLTQQASETLAEWLVDHLPTLIRHLEADLAAIIEASAADVPEGLAPIKVLVSPAAGYEAALRRWQARQ